MVQQHRLKLPQQLRVMTCTACRCLATNCLPSRRRTMAFTTMASIPPCAGTARMLLNRIASASQVPDPSSVSDDGSNPNR
jgi:hypothetical protein